LSSNSGKTPQNELIESNPTTPPKQVSAAKFQQVLQQATPQQITPQPKQPLKDRRVGEGTPKIWYGIERAFLRDCILNIHQSFSSIFCGSFL